MLLEKKQTVHASEVIEVLRNLAPRLDELVSILATLMLGERAWVHYLANQITRNTQIRVLFGEHIGHGLV